MLTQEPLKTIVLELIERKRAGVEMDDGPAIPELHEFLAHELERIEKAAGAQPSGHANLNQINEFFRATLRATWGANY